MSATQSKSIPLYQRYSDAGVRTANLAGVTAALKAGDDATKDGVTWLVQSGTLSGLIPRAEYDLLRDTAGTYWVVKEVGAPVGDVYPLLCERWKGDNE